MTDKFAKLTTPESPVVDVDCAIVLAGGLGTRLRAAVAGVPKSMAILDGRPFLEHLMDFWITQGITRIILAVGYMHDSICEHFGTHYKSASISYSIEHSPLGTGGGLLKAVRQASDKRDILVLNGDTIFEVTLGNLVQFHRDKESEWTIALFSSDKSARHLGVGVDHDGRIIEMQIKLGGLSRVSNGGAYIICTQMLVNQMYRDREYSSLEDEILPNLIASRRRIFGLEFDAVFIDIGIPEDYLRADLLMRTRRLESSEQDFGRSRK